MAARKRDSVLLTILAAGVCVSGCTYRLGAVAFSKTREEVAKTECFNVPTQTIAKDLASETPIYRILRNPTDSSPEMAIYVGKEVKVERRLFGVRDCTETVSLVPTGEYIYDPIEMGGCPVFAGYTAVSYKSDKSAADYIFLVFGWPFVLADLATWGIYGNTAGAVFDLLIPFPEESKGAFGKVNADGDFVQTFYCGMGPIGFGGIGGLVTGLLGTKPEPYTQRL